MEQYIEKLTKDLLEKNPNMPVGRARVWVELLWSDIEASSARAGYEFKGAQHTEKMVSHLIASYGDKLHEFAGRNPKYVHLLDSSEDTIQ